MSQTNSLVNYSSPIPNKNNQSIPKKGNFSFEISASVLPKARITRDSGNYNLQSRLQSAFDGGINYIYNVNRTLSISAGFHVIIGKWNYFSYIPPEDLKDFYNLTEPYLIEDKDIWGAIRIPFWIEKKLNTKTNNPFSVKMGLSLRYSGFMTDEDFGWLISHPNGQVVEIFSARYQAKNDYKPWVTFLSGISKNFTLSNQNILSLGLVLDISNSYFFNADYTFKIPNQPITSGTYKINGSSLGLSVQYIFTGTNKRLIKEYEKKKEF